MVKRVLIFSVLIAVLFFSCNDGVKNHEDSNTAKAVDETTLGLIKSDVQSSDENLLGAMPQYSMQAPGTSERIERAFENAPPMIPHMTIGFFPITKQNNICLSCHMPDKVEVSGAVALPVSHFTDYRPSVKKKGQLYAVDAKEGEVVSKKLDKLSPSRYNCSQCHVPQANVTVDIKNNFERVFRQDSSKTSSNLDKNMNEGIN